MPQLLLVRGARQLLTLRGPGGLRRGEALGDLAIIEDGSVLIRDGLIASVGSTRRLENLKEIRGAPEVDVNGAIVLPGFVDPGIAVTASSYAAASGASARRKRSSSALYSENLALLRACVQYGTLNAQLKATSTVPDTRAEIALLRQLTHIGDHPVGMIRAWSLSHPFTASGSEGQDYLAALSLLVRRKLAHALEVSGDSEAPVRRLIESSNGLLRFQLSFAWEGGSAASLAGLLASLPFVSVFCPPSLSRDEVTVLAAAPAPIVISPGQNFFDDIPRGAVRELAARGAALALSAGYHSEEAPTFNMQMAIALAVGRLGLTTEQAIAAATINAAHAIGRGRTIGSLEAGKRADLLVLNLPDYREIPRRFGTNHVGMVIRDGKIILNRTGWKVTAA